MVLLVLMFGLNVLFAIVNLLVVVSDSSLILKWVVMFFNIFVAAFIAFVMAETD